MLYVSINILANSKFLFFKAKNKGVCPILFLRSISQPLSFNKLHIFLKA